MISHNEKLCCPDCGGQLKVRDSKRRIVKDETGEQYIFMLRRLYCSQCKKLHTEMPDFMEKFKHYSKNVIESVLNGECDFCTADDSTIRRWKK